MLARYADRGSCPRVRSRCCLWPAHEERGRGTNEAGAGHHGHDHDEGQQACFCQNATRPAARTGAADGQASVGPPARPWFGAMTVHVLAYIWRLPRLARSDLAGRAGRRANELLAGRGARWLLLMASVLTGLLMAVLTVHQAGAWTGLPGLGH